MAQLTKSLPIIKERNCNASLVLDTRTNRKNASEYPLAIRFTVDRKIFYHSVGSSYSEILVSDKSFFAIIKIRAVSICRIQPFFVI